MVVLKARMLSLLFGLLLGSSAFSAMQPIEHSSPDLYARKLLENEGFSQDFIKIVTSRNDEEERDKVIQLNVFGFLYKGDYSVHRSKEALTKCRDFIRKHKTPLNTAERIHGVPKEIIAALLWVETKHGKRIGSFRVPSVFYYLLQADHPEVTKRTIQNMEGRIPASEDMEAARTKVIQRSKAKATWALTELRSLEKIHKKRAKDINALVGSHSGAFGVPQFIPSSYLEWARPRTKKRHPDLFKMEDAIYSVAFYLKVNGWKRNDQNAQREAIYHYNRSEGYVNVIRQIAGDLTTRKM